MVDSYCGFNCGRLHFWPGAPRGFSEVEKCDPLMVFFRPVFGVSPLSVLLLSWRIYSVRVVQLFHRLGIHKEGVSFCAGGASGGKVVEHAGRLRGCGFVFFKHHDHHDRHHINNQGCYHHHLMNTAWSMKYKYQSSS